jgi:O-antigen/teichoic acid export membrane protein
MWKPGKLARNMVVMSFGFGLRAVAQAIVFLVIARILGVEGYGAFVAVLAIASALSGLCGLGAHVLLVRDVACSAESFSRSWGFTLAALGWGIPVVFLFYLAISQAVIPDSIPFTVIICIGIGELILWPLANATVFAYQGYEHMGRASRMMLAPVVARLVSALFFLLVSKWLTVDPLLSWSFLYALSGLITVLYVHRCVIYDLGRPVFPAKRQLLKYVQESIPFSFWAIAEKLYVDVDKVMLARLVTLETAGIYSAAYRFVDMAFLPLYSLLNVAAPRFFRAGQTGISNAMAYSVRIFIAPFLYGIFVGVILFYGAPLLPYLTGEDYTEVIHVTRWLAWLPVMTLPRIITQYALATSGFQRIGAAIIFSGAVMNVILNCWWIPMWGWRGAAAATYAAEVLMSLLMFGVVFSKRTETAGELQIVRKTV